MARIVGLVFEEFEEVLVCEICGKEFKTQKGLDNHVQKEHAS